MPPTYSTWHDMQLTGMSASQLNICLTHTLFWVSAVIRLSILNYFADQHAEKYFTFSETLMVQDHMGVNVHPHLYMKSWFNNCKKSFKTFTLCSSLQTCSISTTKSINLDCAIKFCSIAWQRWKANMLLSNIHNLPPPSGAKPRFVNSDSPSHMGSVISGGIITLLVLVVGMKLCSQSFAVEQLGWNDCW